MAIPKFEKFLYPFLQQLKNKDVTTKEMRETLIKHFNLTAEDCSLRTKNGTAYQFNDRINWSRQWLRRALFIEIPQRGVYHITERGLDFLNSHNDLTEKDLLKYPEFAEYSGLSASSESCEQVDVFAEDTAVRTPTEDMDTAFKTINDDLAVDLLQKVLEMSPNFFEKLVLDLLLNMGFGSKSREMAVVTPTSHDNGVDGIIPEDALGLDKIYIQAKRYTDTSVSKPDIHKFIGALDEQKASKGVFITTSKFTNGARESAYKASKKIVLIDGKELADYMI